MHDTNSIFWRAALCAALIVATGPAVAADATAMVTHSTDVYSGPGKYPILTRLARGVQVKLLGCMDKHAWCEVGSGQTRGWVSANTLEITSHGKLAGKK